MDNHKDCKYFDEAKVIKTEYEEYNEYWYKETKYYDCGCRYIEDIDETPGFRDKDKYFSCNFCKYRKDE